jgi:hypothetical protein
MIQKKYPVRRVFPYVDNKWLKCYNTSMYKVIGKTITFNVMTLNEAMSTAKAMNEFVTIKSADFEMVGMFGVDSVVDGKCPDGVAYTWNKASRIGATRRR